MFSLHVFQFCDDDNDKSTIIFCDVDWVMNPDGSNNGGIDSCHGSSHELDYGEEKLMDC